MSDQRTNARELLERLETAWERARGDRSKSKKKLRKLERAIERQERKVAREEGSWRYSENGQTN
jgi:hypothetical protein